ncbi:polysaccharide biosynthesis protein [Cohnella pontilimi]|uniref:Polysaccharide biosynthesis protein n=1 Tax=Cohnella pontilimi TaxID=2564100 RepID=A0A4U0F271_9BACL|nr:polysaccharide biosynthesis C-terminal domain-containing protein [Cohnella pontilimi]TJY38567.1 polysaccharide biosynthesis protein [Cohnella pontilimi]
MRKERYGQREQGQAILKGAALLGGAALVSKLIGTLQKIPLQNFGGDEVFGLYSAVYAFAVLWLTLAAAGLPTAVSALVAEREAEGDELGAQRIVRWSLGLLSVSGLIAFTALQLGAGLFSEWMGVPEAASAIRTSSIALLFAPAAAALRGYRQGQMSMLRPAVSQLIEQSARVAFMLMMLGIAVGAGWSGPATAAAVHGGLAAGAAAGLIVMLWPEKSSGKAGVWIRRKAAASTSGNTTTKRMFYWQEPRLALVKRIAGIALPVAAVSVVAPLFGLIDAFTIPRLLQREGADAVSAISQFGVYNRGIALLQLVLMAAAGAAAALVPALTTERVRGDDAAAAERAAFTLRLAWWFGGAAAAGLALLAVPVDIALFADDNGSAVMALLAPAALFGALQAVSGALLQGRGDLRSPAVNLAAAAVFKLALNAALVPAYGITGAAAAMVAAYASAAVLNALSLRSRLAVAGPSLAIAWRSAAALAFMAAAVAATGFALGALTHSLPHRAGALLTALPGVAVGLAAFAAGLIAAGAVGPQQWRELPGLSAASRADVWLLRLHAALRRQTPSSPHSREG